MADTDVLALPTDTLTRACNTDASTVRRWKRAGKLPATLARLVRLVVLGDLTELGFRDWRMLRGQLYSPEDWQFSPGDVLSLVLLRQQLAELQRERRAFLNLDAQPKVEDQPDYDQLRQSIA